MSRNARSLVAQSKSEKRFDHHLCHAIGCETPVAPKHLMCALHWFQVPQDIRDRVIQNFNPEQCKKKIRPSLEWLKAAREAINSIRRSDKAADEINQGKEVR